MESAAGGDYRGVGFGDRRRDRASAKHNRGRGDKREGRWVRMLTTITVQKAGGSQ